MAPIGTIGSHCRPVLRIDIKGVHVPRSRYVSHVYYAVYTLYNDYYYQIIIEVAQLRQHKQRLNDLRTQLG